MATAFELVDWLRLIEDRLGVEEVKQVVDILSKLYPPSISSVAEYVLPIGGFLWHAVDRTPRFSDIRQ